MRGSTDTPTVLWTLRIGHRRLEGSVQLLPHGLEEWQCDGHVVQHMPFHRRCQMPKYLLQASFTTEGAKGLLKEGGTKRRAAVEQLIKSVGGKLEAFYFTFGESDVFLLVDAPDNASVVAVSLTTVAAGGVTNLRTSVLLTPEDMDQATKKSVSYRPPGQ